MECPTCFQKIIVPQAPAGTQNLILTGTKAGERPPTKTVETGAANAHPATGISGVSVVLLIFVFIAVAVGFVYRGTLFKPHSPLGAKDRATNQLEQVEKRSTPGPVAPPASDTNWTLNLKGAVIPDSAAAGRVQGQNFICERATLQGGLLTLHDGELSFSINFSGASAEMLAGKNINVATNAASAARVVLRWKDGDRTMHETFTNGYAMRLDFDKAMDNRISGKIYLCTSDESESYVAGTFKAEIKKGKPRR